jgi:hypothetical protein
LKCYRWKDAEGLDAPYEQIDIIYIGCAARAMRTASGVEAFCSSSFSPQVVLIDFGKDFSIFSSRSDPFLLIGKSFDKERPKQLSYDGKMEQFKLEFIFVHCATDMVTGNSKNLAPGRPDYRKVRNCGRIVK